ncbi:MAG: putative molybdenum carrier protein [Planctomycetaceae bacterium]|jgi:hypothetical protein|nr:putative molybdenum carrier protein [Planctomycetaceae bacterium]
MADDEKKIATTKPRLKIVSGGQTGADRAALDVAIELGLPHGGWCPRNRFSEDGKIPQQYILRETKSTDYSVRTRWNVRDSDGTLIFYYEPLEGGTAFTWQCAVQENKPVFLVELNFPPSPEAFYRWLNENSIRTLNVAGPRESRHLGISAEVKQIFVSWLNRAISANS